MKMSFRVGILSTIDNPLLPHYISSILDKNINDIAVICDSMLISDKDKKIWIERTGNEFEKKTHDNTYIYSINEAKTPFYFVQNHNDNVTKALLETLSIDVLLNGGTPRKLSTEILESVPFGVVNIHPGLLPEYRGCSAVEWALFNKDKIGNTAHFMTQGYDEGPIIFKEWYNFKKSTDYKSIRIKVYKAGVTLAGKALKEIKDKKMKPCDGIPQNEEKAKYWKPIPNDKFKQIIKR